jgi:hypothetical protein
MAIAIGARMEWGLAGRLVKDTVKGDNRDVQ